MSPANDNPRPVLFLGSVHVDEDRFEPGCRVVMIEEGVIEAGRREVAEAADSMA
jgi:hypothetical protein